MRVNVSHATQQVTITLSPEEASRLATGIRAHFNWKGEPDADDASVIENHLMEVMEEA